MGDFIVQLSILDPLYTLFGWLTRVLYDFFGNYGLAIIFLTVIIRGALIPLNIRSQKSMLKMQALSGKQVTNRDFEGWAEIFHDEVIATTLLDRLIENCQVLKLTGGSYRLRTHRNIFEIES